MLQPVSLSGAVVPGAGKRGGQWVCTGIWDLATLQLFSNLSPDEHSRGKQCEPPAWGKRWHKTVSEQGRRRVIRTCYASGRWKREICNPKFMKDVTPLPSHHVNYSWIFFPCSPLLGICQSERQTNTFCLCLSAWVRFQCPKNQVTAINVGIQMADSKRWFLNQCSGVWVKHSPSAIYPMFF